MAVEKCSKLCVWIKTSSASSAGKIKDYYCDADGGMKTIGYDDNRWSEKPIQTEKRVDCFFPKKKRLRNDDDYFSLY